MQYQPAPTAADITRFTAELTTLPLPEPLQAVAAHLNEILPQLCDRAANLAQLYMLLNHHFADRLGLTWTDLPVSLLVRSSSFAAFAADMLARADEVRNCYNQALTDFRRDNNIRNPAQPLPDLIHDPSAGPEAPFWSFRPNHPRRPLFAQPQHSNILLSDGHDMSVFLPLSQLQTGSIEGPDLRPRALTLTVFARLFLADTFIHGIGGARYDQVADRFIQNYYGIETPAFACTSATLRLPFGDYLTPTQAKDKLRHLTWLTRDLHYNPQRYVKDDPLAPDRLAAIAESDRLRRENAPPHERRLIFEKIRGLNEQIAAHQPQVAANLKQQIAQVNQAQESGRVAHDREYFFALHDLQDLKQLPRNMQP